MAVGGLHVSAPARNVCSRLLPVVLRVPGARKAFIHAVFPVLPVAPGEKTVRRMKMCDSMGLPPDLLALLLTR